MLRVETVKEGDVVEDTTAGVKIVVEKIIG
jgi:hypothetical protein